MALVHGGRHIAHCGCAGGNPKQTAPLRLVDLQRGGEIQLQPAGSDRRWCRTAALIAPCGCHAPRYERCLSCAWLLSRHRTGLTPESQHRVNPRIPASWVRHRYLEGELLIVLPSRDLFSDKPNHSHQASPSLQQEGATARGLHSSTGHKPFNAVAAARFFARTCQRTVDLDGRESVNSPTCYRSLALHW